MRWPAGSSGRRRPLPVSLDGDRWQNDGHRAHAPGGDRRGAPSGLTPGPDIAAAGQGLAEVPGQGARKAKKQAKGLISEACDQRQLVLQFPLLHRKSCGPNRRPTAHCGLHRPHLRAVRTANPVIKGRI